MKYLAPFLLLIALLLPTPASSHDPDCPSCDEWYMSLMQPDVPTVSCCGESDAYWADEVHVQDGKVYAIVTDDRPDEPRHRHHVEPGTAIEIPPNKLKWDKGNPTGHGIVFLSNQNYVWCYVEPGGV